MDLLKQQIAEYVLLKEDIKKMTERKNNLEKSICNSMDEFNISKFELPDGGTLTYKVKESLALGKDKERKSRNKE